MTSRRPRYHLIDLLMVILFCGLVAGVVRWVAMVVSRVRRLAPLDRSFPATFVGIEIAFVAWFIAWKAIRARRAAPECVECGRRFVPPKKTTDPALCPRCRQRSLSPARLKSERRKNFAVVALSVLILSILLALFLSGWVGDHFDRAYWIALPLISAGAVLGSFVLLFLLIFVVLIVVATVRSGLLRSERHALAHARKVAGSEGEVVSAGTLTVWYSGPADPVPDLMEQFEIARRRFEARLGGTIGDPAPVRILCFHERDALVAYHRQAPTDLWNLDGVFLRGSWATITLSTEVVPHRLVDRNGTIRVLFGYHSLEAYKGFLPRPWLQLGLVNSVAGGDEDGRARLNRKMVASLTRGTSLGTDLFRLESGALFRLLKGSYDHDRYSRFAQFTAQSWSLVEYLVGDEAPEDRRAPFRAFLEAIRPRGPDESAFQHQFGYGFDRLLELWKSWALERGIGTHQPPPPPIRDALSGRVIPIVRDRRAKVMDRIQAVRDLGRLGYAFGADALIDLLHDPGEIPREEVVRSLEAISGLVLGDDPDRWRTWLSGLPREVSGEDAAPLPASAS